MSLLPLLRLRCFPLGDGDIGAGVLMSAANSGPGTLFATVDIEGSLDDAGAISLRSRVPLGAYPDTLLESLRRWVRERPAMHFLEERDGSDWKRCTYAEAWQQAGELAPRILGAGCSQERPLMILAPNGIEHAVVALAAMRVGVPACPVSMAYAAPSANYARLRHVAEVATPALLYTPPGELFAASARAVSDCVGAVVVGSGWDSLPSAGAKEMARAESAVGAESIAKLLFTSGSTAKPKAVPNTHRMLCSNQAALAAVWPGVFKEPLAMVDWLPWNHTFGGNFTFNMAITHGGTYSIDSGKPTPALIGQTVANLKERQPTVYFNVPAGYDALLPHLRDDAQLRRSFFSRLKLLFTAAAALPQSTQDHLQELAVEATGRSIPMVAGWGSTETAPCSTAVHFPNSVASNIGVPLPGVQIRLVPDQEKLELRVKGPNVMSGYWRDTDASATAFDADGFYRMGDAGRLLDARHPELGILFDGRISENFKLESGTWVQVGALRLAVIEATRPLVIDAVVAGHDRSEIGLLLFPNLPACRALLGEDCTGDIAAIRSHEVISRVAVGLKAMNASATGSSTRVGRFLLLGDPPSANSHEITDKGYINQRGVLTNRASSVELLYGSSGHAVPQ